MSLRLTSIQRFCTSDGPGIRTTLFTKGCSIRCPWCANPENISGELQFFKSKKCISENISYDFCRECAVNMSDHLLNRMDYEQCPVNAIGIYGKDWETKDVESECLKDKCFYDNDGGVTVSGGEPLLQADELSKIFLNLKKNSVGCCIETSLYAGKEKLKCLIDYLDYIYIDFKILDARAAKKVLKADMEVFEDNLNYLFSNFPANKICVRIPLVKNYTCTKGNIQVAANYLKYYKPGLCEIFSVHNLGKSKYETLGMRYREFEITDIETLRIISEYLRNVSGVRIKINTI